MLGRRGPNPVYQATTMYAQLTHIIVVTLPAGVLGLTEQTQFILADVETCRADIQGPLDIRMYDTMSILQVVDMVCVQCLVGRVKVMKDQGKPIWAIIDRSGELDAAIYAEEDLRD